MHKRFISMICGVFLWTIPALAQEYEATVHPDIQDSSTVIEWLIGAAFLAGCMVVAFKPAKRSNIR